MRLIDADLFVEDLTNEATNLYLDGLNGTPRSHRELYGIIDRIQEQPSVEALTLSDIQTLFKEIDECTVKRVVHGGKVVFDKSQEFDRIKKKYLGDSYEVRENDTEG